MHTKQHGSPQLTQNQNNLMSDNDLRDGSRNSETVGRDGKKTAVEYSPEEQEQHEPSTLEAFGEEGAGIAAKE